MGQITQNRGGARDFAQSHGPVRWITGASAGCTTEPCRRRVEYFNNCDDACCFSQLDGQTPCCTFARWLLGAFHQFQCGRRPMQRWHERPGPLPQIRMHSKKSLAPTVYISRGKTPHTAIQRRRSCSSTCWRYAERVGSKWKSQAVRNDSPRGVASACGAVLGCAAGACGHSPCSSRQEHRCGKVSGVSLGQTTRESDSLGHGVRLHELSRDPGQQGRNPGEADHRNARGPVPHLPRRQERSRSQRHGAQPGSARLREVPRSALQR